MEKNVKVYFEDGDIRRFMVRAPTASEQYKQLLETIAPFMQGKTSFGIFYKDEENDFVTLSTAQEFEVCAACPNNRDVLRIYVRKSNGSQTPSVAAAGNAAVNVQVWPEVTCDKCNSSPLKGMRYKCTVCPDYDECGKCFSSNPQHPHAMIALTDPHSEEWKRMWHRRALGRHVMGPQYGGPHAHRHRGMQGMADPRSHPRRHGCGGTGDASAAERAADGSGRSFADWMGLAKASASYAQQQLLNAGNAAAVAESASTAAAGPSSSIPGVSFTTCQGGHPKVEVDVDMNDLIRQPKNVFETVFRAVEEAGKMFQSMAAPVSAAEEKPFQQQVSTSSQTIATAKEDKKEGTSDAVQQQDVEMRDNATVVVDVFVDSKKGTENKQQAAENPLMSTSVEYVGTVTPPVKAEPTAPPAGWTLLTDEKADRKQEMEDMINACIESMKDLGFDTEKPWIRELVSGCQGNLSRVMDELTPGANIRLD